jgi:UDP-N-acetyl-D-glucosamine dehydrogenase
MSEPVEIDKPWLARLLQRAASRELTVGVVGLGYVGLPLALRFALQGVRVIGFDIDRQKVNTLAAGHSYLAHIPEHQLGLALRNGIAFSDDFSKAAQADALIICVPTPLNDYREPDLSYVLNTVNALLPHIRAGCLVSLESTTYPGTTEEELRPRLESSGLRVGADVFLVFSPEREDPGNPNYSTHTIPKIIGGSTQSCLKAGLAVYALAIDRMVPVSSTRTAEMTKLLENIQRAVNIGLVNEMKIVADRMGIDIHEVVAAAATKPFGFTPYYPGPGWGGHCIPVDPFYLTWKARAYGLHTQFIELAGEINNAMPRWVVDKLRDALNARSLPLKGSRILVLGIAYKKNIGDMRESPAVEIMEILSGHGAQLAYCDPHVPVFPPMRRHHFELSSVVLTSEELASHDCVLLATDHDLFDYPLIASSARLIVDTRGRFARTLAHVVAA